MISGKKYQRRFSIIDENTIALDEKTASLSDIARIKRHPIFNTVFIKVNLIHIGALRMFFGVFGTAFSGSYAYLASGAVVLAGGIYGAIKSPNLNKGHHIHKNWHYSI